MNLIIDQGNSITKYAVFKGKNIIRLEKTNNIDSNLILELLSLGDINDLFVSSVRLSEQEIRNQLIFIKNNVNILVFNNKTKIPIKLNYKTPETLGQDRIAALVGASKYEINYPKLVIDAGTAITVDYLDANNVFQGGNISPGIKMRFKALNYFTGKLPDLRMNSNVNYLFGQSTNEAIWAGVQNGVLFEIQGYIDKILEKNKNIKIILTGGDAVFFENNIKNCIFAIENLVFEGLNEILLFNYTQEGISNVL